MHSSLKGNHLKVGINKNMNFLKLTILSVVLVITGCNQPAPQSSSKSDSESAKLVVESGPTTQANLPANYSIGNVAEKSVIAGWDIEVRPDGQGLPVGSGSVEDGEELFEDKCSMCHGSFGEGVDQWPKLAGGEGTLTEARPEKTVGSFWPYASTLWDYINRAMPFPAPQSLEPDEVYAITAYILSMNEIVDDEFVLTNENFSTVEMPNKDGFYVDDRPDTQNTRCMENCKDGSKINVVLGPEYSLGKKSTDKAAEPVATSQGKKTYDAVCNVCHGAGIADAPKLGNVEDWATRITQEKSAIYKHALEGLNGMPAKGGRADMSDEQITAAVDYMLSTLN